MNTQRAYINGFVKRAADYGMSSSEAFELLKRANEDIYGYARIAGLGGLTIGKLIELLAHHGTKAKTPEERIDKNEIKEWAKKYLKSPNVIVLPKRGLNNASYSSVDHNGQKYHVIQYDPSLSKSVGAHEIGHGMRRIPRVPLSDFIGPILANSGALMAGYTGGEAGLLPLAAGLGIQAPTLADEWSASHNAKKILEENKIPAKGLNRAWLTYAAPLITTGLSAGAGYLARKNNL